ncbi:MAG: outer membrane beta-barrel protein, partial [Bacteroidota bacterium]
MTRLFSILCLLTFCCSSPMVAQEIASSFRVGLNFSRLPGPSEMDAAGNNLEDHRNTTGFHVAGGAVFKFLENYGMKAELVFSQRGGTYEYNGIANRVFQTTLSGNPLVITGEQQNIIRVTNSYVEIPVTGYVKVGKKLEFQAGASISFLVSSKGEGNWIFRGNSNRDGNPFDISIDLNHNYLKDDPFTEAVNDLDPATTTEFIADGETIRIPN